VRGRACLGFLGVRLHDGFRFRRVAMSETRASIPFVRRSRACKNLRVFYTHPASCGKHIGLELSAALNVGCTRRGRARRYDRVRTYRTCSFRMEAASEPLQRCAWIAGVERKRGTTKPGEGSWLGRDCRRAPTGFHADGGSVLVPSSLGSMWSPSNEGSTEHPAKTSAS